MTKDERERQVAIRRSIYERCAALLGAEHTFREPAFSPRWNRCTGKLDYPVVCKTRWNYREPGNGRFDPYGTVRVFSENCIQVNLSWPKPLTRTCSSPEEVYDLLTDVVRQDHGLTRPAVERD